MNQDIRQLEKIQEFLFASEQEMNEAHLPEREQVRLLRLRQTYTYWLGNPRLDERAMATWMKQTFQIGTSAAYNDLRVLKVLLGSLNTATTEYYRWVFLQRCEEGFQMARLKRDPAAYARVLTAFLKGTQLDKDKAQTIDWNLIVPDALEFTGDPAEAGITVDPDARAKAQKMYASWRKSLLEAPEADYEELRSKPENKPAKIDAQIHTQG